MGTIWELGLFVPLMPWLLQSCLSGVSKKPLAGEITRFMTKGRGQKARHLQGVESPRKPSTLHNSAPRNEGFTSLRPQAPNSLGRRGQLVLSQTRHHVHPSSPTLLPVHKDLADGRHSPVDRPAQTGPRQSKLPESRQSVLVCGISVCRTEWSSS